MKLAFLFLTVADHAQGEVWQRFFAEASPQDFTVYCHARHPQQVTQPFLKDNLLPHTVDASHADISLVHAFLLLLRAAWQDPDNEYFILLSDSCVPLYRFEAVQTTLVQAGRSWIAYGHDVRDEHRHRHSQLADADFLPFESFQKQHQWLVLRRDLVLPLLENDFTGVFANVYAPDEHYVVNVLAHLGIDLEQAVHNAPPTFVNWAEYERVVGTHKGQADFTKLRPRTYRELSIEDVLYARSHGSLFLRKVSAETDCSVLWQTPPRIGPPPLPAIRRRHRPFWTLIVAGPPGAPSPAADSTVQVVAAPYEGRAALYRAVNRALRQALGRWIHVVFHDTVLAPGCHALMQAALEGTDAGMGFCRYQAEDDEGGVFSPDLAGDQPGRLPQGWHEALLGGNPLNLPAVVMRRDVLEAHGAFYEDLPWCGDWELYIRTAMAAPWWYQPERLVTHRVPPAEDLDGGGDERRMRQRLAIFWAGLHPDRPLPAVLTAHIPNFLVEA